MTGGREIPRESKGTLTFLPGVARSDLRSGSQMSCPQREPWGPFLPPQLQSPSPLYLLSASIVFTPSPFLPGLPPSSQVLLRSEKRFAPSQPASVQPPHSGGPDYNPRAERHLVQALRDSTGDRAHAYHAHHPRDASQSLLRATGQS